MGSGNHMFKVALKLDLQRILTGKKCVLVGNFLR